MKDITNEVKDFKKYLIIPKNDVAMEVHSSNPEDAMSCFAWAVDFDMSAYFRAVTEEEYNEIKEKKLWEARKKTQVDFYISELEMNFDEVAEEDINEIAERAWEMYCGKEGEGLTEYETLEKAVDEYEKENPTNYTKNLVEVIKKNLK